MVSLSKKVHFKFQMDPKFKIQNPRFPLRNLALHTLYQRATFVAFAQNFLNSGFAFPGISSQ
jgi:hypothetical protein